MKYGIGIIYDSTNEVDKSLWRNENSMIFTMLDIVHATDQLSVLSSMGSN